MADITGATRTATGPSVGMYLKNNMRQYGLLLALVAIMAFFQIVTDGTMMKPLNLTNLVLQNSYVVIMALGMLLVIVAGHIDLSVGSVAAFVGALSAVMIVNLALSVANIVSVFSTRQVFFLRQTGLPVLGLRRGTI